jgi:hypothetical protein
VEFIDHVANAGDSAWQVANKVELVAVVYAKIGIERPDEDGVDAAEASFDVCEKPINRVLILVRIEECAIPDQQLDLRIHVLRPSKLGPLVLRVPVTQTLQPFLSPRFHFRPPGFRRGGIFGPRKQYIRGAGRLGEI